MNGNGNGMMMTSLEPQLGERGLTRVIPGEGKVETLLVETGQWLTMTRPLQAPGSSGYLVSPSDVILEALSNALGQGTKALRALVKVQVRVEVLGYEVNTEVTADSSASTPMVTATATDPSLDEPAAQFIGSPDDIAF